MKLGDFVCVGGDIPGYITAICHRRNGVSYEVTWWDGRDRKSDWFTEHEITVKVRS